MPPRPERGTGDTHRHQAGTKRYGSNVQSEPKPAGRPPGPHDHTLAKILPTALRLFIDEGGVALTPTRLHRETGVSRATIYRNWPEPADLIEIMLARATEQPTRDRFVGDVRKDLYTALDILLHRFEHRPARAFFAACIEYGRNSERVERASRAFIAGILAPFETVLQAAVDAGTITGNPDELVSELAGPLVLEHVVMGKHIPKARARRVVDRLLDYHLVD